MAQERNAQRNDRSDSSQQGGAANRSSSQQSQTSGHSQQPSQQQSPQPSQQPSQQQSRQSENATAREMEQRIPSSSELATSRTADRGSLARGGRIATPWDLMRRMSAELDRLVGDQTARIDWIPQVEVLQRQDAMVVRVELAGMSPDEIDVIVDNGMLTISGVRQQERREEDDGVLRTERSYGTFARTIPLPQGTDEEHITAAFRDGVLELTIPMSGRGRGRRIAVQGASESQSNSKGG